ncbi:MAG: tetratricopeptide repeat protein [Planctomycetes bacterium]|nr:tetratricopeptide repeat protein [Planctomycetota bacterium]
MSTSFFVRGRRSALPELESAARGRLDTVRLGDPHPRATELPLEERPPYLLLGPADTEPDAASDERLFLARDMDLGREIELRVLVIPAERAAERLRAFADESLVAARVQHPCARTIYEVGEARDGSPFIASELVPGLSLRQLFRSSGERPFRCAMVIPVLELVAQGLAAAHRRGIAHGDLRAEHVRLGRFGEVKVLGWEHARRFEASASSAAYEVEDVRAFGRLVGEALAADRDANGVDERAGGDPALEELVARCTRSTELAGAESERISAQRCAEELADWIALSDRRAHESALGAERAAVVARGVRRRRILGTAIASAIACAIVGGGWAWSAAIEAERERMALARRDVEPRLRETLALVSLARAGSADALEPWLEAAAALKAAEELAAARATPRELHLQIEELVREVETSSKAAGAERQRREEWRRHLAELRELRRECARTWDFAHADRRYEEIFARLGCGAEIPFAQRVERLGASGFVDELVAALDAWWDFRRMSSWEAGEVLLRLASAIDSDLLRQDLRRALSQRQTLVEFARSRELDRLAPSTWILLARALDAHGEGTLGLEMLERACAQHPTDLWLHIDLSAAALDGVEPKRLDLALRHGWAAFALDPQSEGARNRLALAWLENGEHQRAIELLWQGRQTGELGLGTSLNLTLALQRAGEASAAIAVADEALIRFPDSVELRVNRALALDDSERPAEALEQLRAALAIEPRHAEARGALGALLCDRFGRLDEAEELFLDLLRDQPKKVHLYLNLAVVARRRGDEAAAVAWARRGLEVVEAPVLHALAGNSLHLLGRVEEAAVHLEHAVRDAEPSVQALNLLAEIRIGQKRSAEARALLERGIRAQQPQSAWSYLRLAEILQLEGSEERAMAIAEQGLKRFPRFAGLHRVRGSLFESHRRELHRALECYLAGAAPSPFDPTVDQLGCLLMAGGVLIDLRQLERARALFDRAELHPLCDARFSAALGRNRYAAGDVEGAERALRRAVDGHVDSPDAWKQLARIYAESDRLEEIEVLAERVPQLFPKDASVAGYWGFLLVTASSPRPECAELLLAHVTALEPQKGEPWYYLGVARSQQGRYADALAAWERALAQNVRGVEIYTNLGYAHYRLGRHELARHWLERALQQKGDHATALNDLGLVLWDLGELEEAAQVLERALERDPANGAVQLSLAQITLELGHFERAREAFARAAQLELPPTLGAELARDLVELEALERWSARWPQIAAERSSWPQEPSERWRLAQIALRHEESGVALELLRDVVVAPPAGVALDRARFRAAWAACELAGRRSLAAERAALYGEAITWLRDDLESFASQRPLDARLGIERRLRHAALAFLRDPELLVELAPEPLDAARSLAKRYAEVNASLRLLLGDVLPAGPSK